MRGRGLDSLESSEGHVRDSGWERKMTWSKPLETVVHKASTVGWH